MPRDQWAQYPADPTKMTKSDGQFDQITLHHTGSEDTPQGVENLHRDMISDTERRARNVGDALGLGTKTYPGQGDVGYHFLIGKDGTIYEGRSLDYEGAQVHGHNAGNIGIAFLGDYSVNPLSKDQVNSAVKLIDALNNKYGQMNDGVAKPLKLNTHADFDSAKQSELRGAMYDVHYIKKVTSVEWGYK